MRETWYAVSRDILIDSLRDTVPAQALAEWSQEGLQALGSWRHGGPAESSEIEDRKGRGTDSVRKAQSRVRAYFRPSISDGRARR